MGSFLVLKRTIVWKHTGNMHCVKKQWQCKYTENKEDERIQKMKIAVKTIKFVLYGRLLTSVNLLENELQCTGIVKQKKLQTKTVVWRKPTDSFENVSSLLYCDRQFHKLKWQVQLDFPLEDKESLNAKKNSLNQNIVQKL